MRITVLVCSLALLSACAKFDVAEDAAPAAPAAVTAPTDPTAAKPPTNTSTSNPTSSPVTSSIVGEPRIGMEREVLTCEQLAMVPPDANFKFDGTEYAEDIYVTDILTPPQGTSTEYTRELTIALATTGSHLCGLRNSNVSQGNLYERRIKVQQAGASAPIPLGPGTYVPTEGLRFGLETESGSQCQGGTGTNAIGSWPALETLGETSKLTIKKRTDAWLEGTLEVVRDHDAPITVTFRAPICAEIDPAAPKHDDGVCCAN